MHHQSSESSCGISSSVDCEYRRFTNFPSFRSHKDRCAAVEYHGWREESNFDRTLTPEQRIHKLVMQRIQKMLQMISFAFQPAFVGCHPSGLAR
jgi:hypothetical protein